MNIAFTHSRTVSIKQTFYGSYLGCKRTRKYGGVLGRVFKGYKYSVEGYSSTGSDETYWDVVDIDDNHIALKNQWNRYLSVQPGIL